MYVIENITNWIEFNIGISTSIQYNILSTIVIILILWIIRTIFVWIVFKRSKDISARYWAQKASRYIALVMAFLFIGWVWFKDFKHYATILGIASAGLAIALRDPIANLAGWFFIIGRKPFILGDRIQVKENIGDVVDIGLFRFSIIEINNWAKGDETTGRIIHLPNSLVMTSPVSNYSTGFEFIWDELPVRVTFESDWEKAKGILKKIATKHAEKLSADAKRKIRRAAKDYMINTPTLEPMVRTQVDDSGVLLILRFLVSPYDRRYTQELIWEDILREFKKCNDVDFAYPTERRYNYSTEGKTFAPGSVEEHDREIHSKRYE
jgi:small-conductance mechanosensitive channel